MEIEITLADLRAARDAIESWLDAFRDSDPDDAELEKKCSRVEKVADRMAQVIFEMQGPDRPRLRLVKPDEKEPIP